MGYKILGINLSHNSSVCVLDDGETIFFLEEERLSRLKHDPFPIKTITKIFHKYKIDEISLSGISSFFNDYYYKKSIENILPSYFPNIPINTYSIKNHHTSHSLSSFFNSGFKKALSVIVDGSGNYQKNKKGLETETLQIVEYSISIKDIYKNYNYGKSSLVTLTKVYESITNYLGYGFYEAGKIMGLSSYGEDDKNLPNLYINNHGNPKVFFSTENYKGIVYNKNYPYLQLKINPKEWHNNPYKITSLEKNLAYKVQQESQKAVGDLIEKGLKETNLKQICCSGGYFLNCVSNYYLIKRFPNVKFYFEPISNDAGTAMGAAKLAWYQKTQDKTIRPQKTLYYGLEYTKEQILEGIQKYLD